MKPLYAYIPDEFELDAKGDWFLKNPKDSQKYIIKDPFLALLIMKQDKSTQKFFDVYETTEEYLYAELAEVPMKVAVIKDFQKYKKGEKLEIMLKAGNYWIKGFTLPNDHTVKTVREAIEYFQLI